MPAFKAFVTAVFAFSAALVAALFLSGCLFEREIEKDRASIHQGGGSETTISGRVLDASGAPVSGAAIRIRPEGDLPPNLFGGDSGEVAEAPLAYSGPDGTFRLPGIASGSYYVECRDTSNAALLQAEIAAQDSLRLPDAILRPTGSIKGWIAGEGNDFRPYLNDVYVYIPGLWKRQIARPDARWSFQLSDIPAGRYTLRLQPAYTMDLANFKALELYDVEVAPGVTLYLDSLILPERAGLDDPEYTRDSLAAWNIYLANLAPGQELESDWVSHHTSVTGNRIRMLYDMTKGTHVIPATIQSLDALEVIYLENVEGLNLTLAPEISNLPHLKRLWLVGFDMRVLPRWTGKFPELSNLKLYSVGRFPDWALDIPTLTELDLRGPFMTELPKELPRLKKLRILDLQDNLLETLPPELMKMPSLQGVRLRGNKLCSTTAAEKVWIGRQDSLWIAQADPLLYRSLVDTVGWEASQKCGE